MYQPERLDPSRDRSHYPETVPDLVVELLHPTDPAEYTAAVVNIYRRLGIALVWMIDAVERTVWEFGRDRADRLWCTGEVLDGGEVLPGFRLPVAAIFE